MHGFGRSFREIRLGSSTLIVARQGGSCKRGRCRFVPHPVPAELDATVSDFLLALRRIREQERRSGVKGGKRSQRRGPRGKDGRGSGAADRTRSACFPVAPSLRETQGSVAPRARKHSHALETETSRHPCAAPPRPRGTRWVCARRRARAKSARCARCSSRRTSSPPPAASLQRRRAPGGKYGRRRASPTV